jgi:hypothetical protein
MLAIQLKMTTRFGEYAGHFHLINVNNGVDPIAACRMGHIPIGHQFIGIASGFK